MKDLIFYQYVVDGRKRKAREKLIRDAKEKLDIQNVTNIINTCLYLNKTKEVIIDKLVEDCDFTKEESEEYLDMYNKQEL